MLQALKKGQNFESLIGRAEYNSHRMWVCYFPIQICGNSGHGIGTPPSMARFVIFKYMSVVLSLCTLASSGDPVVLCSSIVGSLETLKS
jgi:hypothetical protein